MAANMENYSAKDVVLNERFPISEKVCDLVHKILEVTDFSHTACEEMNTLLLIEAAGQQDKTFKAIDAIVKKSEQETERTVLEGKAIGKTNSVAAAMEEAAVNVNMLAAAAEEMNSTIVEMADNSTRAKTITTQALDQSQKVCDRVNRLGELTGERKGRRALWHS